MSPPGLMARPRPGGSTAPTKNELIAVATLILDNCGIQFGRRKLFRLVDRFKERAPDADGGVFFQYLTAAVQMTVEQQHVALANPDVARIIGYADPTGETAVNNVIRERRRR